MNWPTVQQVEESSDYEQVMRWQRRLPTPANDDELTVLNAVMKRYGELRAADPGAMVAASKAVGW